MLIGFNEAGRRSIPALLDFLVRVMLNLTKDEGDGGCRQKGGCDLEHFLESGGEQDVSRTFLPIRHTLPLLSTH